MIQIDMQIPNSCRECCFVKYSIYNFEEISCVIRDMVLDFKRLDFEGRHEGCPLIDVPENNVVTRSETLNRATDCINRQSAINIAKDLLIEMDEYHQYNQAINNYCAELMKLPSSHPNMCVDAVSRQEAIDAPR